MIIGVDKRSNLPSSGRIRNRRAHVYEIIFKSLRVKGKFDGNICQFGKKKNPACNSEVENPKKRTASPSQNLNEHRPGDL